jgi:hypothetical protein
MALGRVFKVLQSSVNFLSISMPKPDIYREDTEDIGAELGDNQLAKAAGFKSQLTMELLLHQRGRARAAMMANVLVSCSKGLLVSAGLKWLPRFRAPLNFFLNEQSPEPGRLA